ncbi:MAG: signal peptide peptidase SppA, partial [Candidatus Aenigmarchaeota archaeon]|nr:signal peptide peptidase SppA [Candidatus Aenigmarchaeota archaeon]
MSNKFLWLAIFSVIIVVVFALAVTPAFIYPKAAVISVHGQIDYESYAANPEKFGRQVREAEDDPSVKAIVIFLNSPGGSVVASRELARVLTSTTKPTVCWVGDVAASGAYWIASSCNHIVADELSVTGSIGATSAYLQLSGLLKKYDVDYKQLTTGKFKDSGSPYRELTKEEEAMFRDSLDKVLERFAESVSENRNISVEKIKSLEGKAMLGEEALSLGLIDSLGGREEVLRVIEQKTKEKEIKLEFYEKESELETLLQYLP